MKRHILAGIVLALVFSFTCLMSVGLAESDQRFYKFAAAGVASAWFPLGATLSTLVTDQVEGIVMTTTFGGAVANAKMVDADPRVMGFSFGGKAYDAYHGLKPFKKKRQNLRGLFSVAPWVLQIAVPAASPYRSLKDVIDAVRSGKRLKISPSRIGFGTEVTVRRLFRAYGLSYDEIKKRGSTLYFVDRKEQAQLMQNRQLDVLFTSSPPVHPILLQIEARIPVRCIAIEPEIINYMVSHYAGYVKPVIPAGKLKAQKETVQTIGEIMFAMCHKDVPAEDAYAVTKTFWENVDQFKRVLPSIAPYLDPRNPVKGIAIPLHPGALKYYREKGISIP